MKKNIAICAAAIIMAGSLWACGSGASSAPSSANESAAEQDSDGLSIVTTIFPEYDWVQNILGENPAQAQVTMLLDDGVDLHSFQPTAEDILKISTCDMFIYVGGESDDWVEDALKEATNKNMVVINLLDALGDHEETEYDEHVWLSLRRTATLCQNIAQSLQAIDPDNAAVYEKNAADYIAKLNALDEGYTKAVSEAKVKTLVFGDRFPFRYMTEDYGLEYFAAFAGCSAETEASFETITFLAQKVDELGLRSVMTIEGTDHRIAETIVQSTETKDQKILTLDSMQATTAKDVESGVSYLSIMENNLKALEEALQND